MLFQRFGEEFHGTDQRTEAGNPAESTGRRGVRQAPAGVEPASAHKELAATAAAQEVDAALDPCGSRDAVGSLVIHLSTRLACSRFKVRVPNLPEAPDVLRWRFGRVPARAVPIHVGVHISYDFHAD